MKFWTNSIVLFFGNRSCSNDIVFGVIRAKDSNRLSWGFIAIVGDAAYGPYLKAQMLHEIWAGSVVCNNRWKHDIRETGIHTYVRSITHLQ